MRARAALLLLLVAPARAVEARWWKGNLHAHTLWSDGDEEAPVVARWYKERGYQFLCLSEHNKLPDLSGPRKAAEEPGRFLLLPAEEITGRVGKRPVHVNAINLAEPVKRRPGATVLEALEHDVEDVRAQSAGRGRPMLAQANHPNWAGGLRPEDLAAARGLRFFEVYSGHPDARNEGGEGVPGTERAWDQALAARLSGANPEILYGTAVDDAHDFRDKGPERRHGGRGWVMVRAAKLTADGLVRALEGGDFYASSGVTLDAVERGAAGLSLEVRAEPGVEYKIRFIGSRKGGAPGELFLETPGPKAAYRFKGGELYVRAVVVSSKLKSDPGTAGEVEKAWVQPVAPGP